MKNEIRKNFTAISLVLIFIVAPVLFLKITFWYGGGYGLWAVFVTLPLAIILTPIIIGLILLYIYLWATDKKTGFLIFNLIILSTLIPLALITIENFLINKPQTSIITQKKGFYGKYCNKITSECIKYKIQKKYDDIKLIKSSRTPKYFCPYFIAKTNGKTNYIDKENNIIFSEYDNAYIVEEKNDFEQPFIIEKNGKYGVYILDLINCDVKKLAIPIKYEKVYFDSVKNKHFSTKRFIIAFNNNLVDVYVARDEKDGYSDYKLVYKDLKSFFLAKETITANNPKILVKIGNRERYLKQHYAKQFRELERKKLIRNNDIIEKEITEDDVKVYVDNEVEYIGKKILRKLNRNSNVYYEIEFT